MNVSFFVAGLPAPKGSTKSFRSHTSKRIVTLSDNADRLRPWQAAVALTAQAAGVRPVGGPCSIELYFALRRPKGHHGKRGLKPSAPELHTQKPDLDKLVRAVLDGLTGVAWKDDAQVVRIETVKAWATDEIGVGVIVKGRD